MLDFPLEEPAVADSGLARFEEQFLESWRKDLLDRAGFALGAREEHRPALSPCSAPAWIIRSSRSRAGEAARRPLGRPLTAGAVRQALQRSRRKYVDYLLTEVLVSLDRPTQDDLEEELSDLKLLDYCRPYLKRRD